MGATAKGSGSVSLMAVVCVIGFWGGLVGCDDEARDAATYRVTTVEAESDNGDGWRPSGDQIEGWVDEALADSDRGLRVGRMGPGLEMTVVTDTDVRGAEGSERLVVEVDGRVQRPVVTPGASMVEFRADTRIAHVFADGPPSEPQLHALSRALNRSAVEAVVDELRDRALVDHLDPLELAVQIADPGQEEKARKMAIDRAVVEGVGAGGEVDEVVERGLVKAVRTGDDAVVVDAAQAVVDLEIDDAGRMLLDEIQRLSRDGDYGRMIDLLPILAELDALWISIYLETVAEAHAAPHVRKTARELAEERAPVAEQL